MAKGTVNKVILVGNLGSDPEVKTIPSGVQVANFSLATSESWNSQEGEKQERTEWHRLVLWRRLAEVAAQYLTKGSKIYVEGKLQTRSWDDQSGQKRYTTEVVVDNLEMLGGDPTLRGREAERQDRNAPAPASAGNDPDHDDGLPF